MHMSFFTTPSMNYNLTNLPCAWDKFQRHCAFVFTGSLSKRTEKEKSTICYCGWEKKGETVTVLGLKKTNKII